MDVRLLLTVLGLLLAVPPSPAAQSFPQWGNLTPGRFAVGFKVIHAVDNSRSYTSTPMDVNERVQAPRPVRTTLWYPATPSRDARPMAFRDYILQRQTRDGHRVLTPAEETRAISAFAASISRAQSLVNGTLVPLFPDGLPDDRVARMAATPTAAFRDAPQASGRFPVLLSLGDTDEQSIVFEYLASHGYIVALVTNLGTGPAFPGSTDPDRARREAAKSADLEFLFGFVRTLEGVDGDKVAAIGAGPALQPVVRLQSVGALLDLLVVYGGPNAASPEDIARLRIPMLHILVDDLPPDAIDARDRSIAALIHADRYVLRFRGVGHPDLSSHRRAGNPEGATFDKPFEAAATYVRSFLDAHLRGNPQAKSFLRSPAGANGFDAGLLRTEEIPARIQGQRPVVLQSQPQVSTSRDPDARQHHAMTYDPALRRVVIHGGLTRDRGGIDVPARDDLWGWDGRSWTAMSERSGVARVGHLLFADGSGGLFITGGGPQASTERWEGQRWVTVADDAPLKRAFAAGAYDTRRKRFVVFGGRFNNVNGPAGDTWEFDGHRWAKAAEVGPAPRLGAAMVYDERRRVVLLFGGRSGPTFFEDTWTWDGARWLRVATTGPSPRFEPGMVYDSRRGETVLFGGYHSTGRHGDTWIWNGRSWRQLNVSGPSPRNQSFAAYDASRGVTVLFGGCCAEPAGGVLGDTWEWNGVRWERIMGESPVEDVADPQAAQPRRAVGYHARDARNATRR